MIWFPTDDKIIVGWAGLTSHFEDIKRMAPIMKAIHDKYPNTHFVLAGMALKDTAVEITEDEQGNKKFEEKEIEDKSQTYKGRIEALFADIDPNRMKILMLYLWKSMESFMLCMTLVWHTLNITRLLLVSQKLKWSSQHVMDVSLCFQTLVDTKRWLIKCQVIFR